MSRPITDILREIHGGEFSVQCGDELAQVIQACRDTGKAGSLTISLKVKPGKVGAGHLSIEPSCNAKAPEFETPDQLFFVTNSGDLVVENPSQKKLAFTEVVDTSTGEIKTVPMPAQAGG